MTRVAWCSDVHLNFVNRRGLEGLGKALLQSGAESVIITGDISEAPMLLDHLAALQLDSTLPIFFVIGNHDAYRSSVAYMTEKLSRVCADPSLKLTYLSATGVLRLTEKTALIGHDGWYDGESGDFWNSRVALVDFEIIGEFRNATLDENGRMPYMNELRFTPTLKHVWKPIMERLALASASHIDTNLRAAIAQGYKKVLIATHVPPFPGASWHEGKVSNAEYLPFFSNITMGKVILDVMQEHPDVECLVLCGHSHGRGSYVPAANVRVLTGGAQYGSPEVQKPILEIE